RSKMFGAAKANLDKGLDAFGRHEWGRARRLLEESLQEDERATGAYHLGLLYWRGLGGDRHRRAAVGLLRPASGQGHSAAQGRDGLALKAGSGVRRNLDAARAELRAAAGAGNPEAMVALAEMNGPEDARRWLGRASEYGHPPAMRALSDLLLERDPIEAL